MTIERLLTEDETSRAAALDVTSSCIVRAPAGSGKTELLIQRYLALLAAVDEPEEIIAITFTRKAAAEMRSRIVEALELAAGAEPPDRPDKRLTWQLGRRVSGRDAERGWQLARHPARLRIQTIDSLNSELTRQMPLLAGFGAPPRVNEKPGPLYEEAARRTLRLLEQGDAAGSKAMGTLARHLDNNLPRLQALLAAMLPRRDQWLHPVRAGAPPTRAELEGGLERELRAHLHRLSEALPADTRQELAELATLAGRRLREQGSDSEIVCCADLVDLPATTAGDLAPWRGIAELLLTNEGKWRRTLDRRLGFPPEDAAPKTRALELLRRYSGDEALRALLAAVPKLPASRYEDAPWQVLEALLKLLPHAVAELRVVFAEQGEVDFAEVALSALRALGEPEAPTDLALALDYRIRHLLVDEFQDTSVNQFRLLEMLSAGWQPGDGRSLFLVGDPAQSIYRFRQAEVGLFLRAWEHGLGALPLKRLTLSVNFRSRAPLVDWYNRSFPGVFPSRAEVTRGAVPYAESAARRPAGEGAAVVVHPLSGEVREREAELVCRLVEAARREGQLKVAVLVRARSHLAAIVSGLKRAGLRFQAVEIESLHDQPVVQDLLALTRALNHPGDRTAWLAVLRAPWCGLSLAELHGLASQERETPIPFLMEADAAHAEVNSRYARTREVLLDALAGRGRGSLREQVERTWLKLGGPAALKDAEALADAEAYLELLEELDQGGTLPGVGELERRLAELFARPDPEAGDGLQLMTIHKAKGLEFDVVILPGLDAGTRRGEHELLVWLERPREAGEADLLLAPLHATGNEKDPVYAWITTLQQDQERLETARLLYVAATRARERLHLIGGAGVRERDGEPVLTSPKSCSLLALLWPVLEAEFERALRTRPAAPTAERAAAEARFTRLAAGWQIPSPPPGAAWVRGGVLAAEEPVPEYAWVGETLRHVGTVVHRLLQRIAAEGPARWDEARLTASAAVIRQLLAGAGVRREDEAAALTDVMQAVANTLADERGRWLLSAGHQDARSEYALSRFEGGRLVTGIIDRSFVDADGVRWIIDYKTSRHRGTDVDAFLDRERARYTPQLERYADMMRGLETRRVRVGLYFPLMRRFVDWEPEHGREP